MRGHVNNSRNIPVEDLRGLIDYSPETGELTWKTRDASGFWPSEGRSAEHIANLWNSRYAGKPALNASVSGYRHGHMCGKLYRAHRVAFAIYHGFWPAHAIDHINGDKSDNRILNLREATRAENSLNRGLNANNTSGCRGVSWVKRKRTWAVRVSVPGAGRKTIGYFKDFQKATEAYMRHAMEHHGEYFAPDSVPVSSLTGGDKAGLISVEKGLKLGLEARLSGCAR